MADKKSPVASVKAWLNAMEPKKRESTIKGGLIAAGVLGLVGLYYISDQDAKKPPPPKEQPVGIKLGDARMEDDLRAQFEKGRLDDAAQNKAMATDIDSQKQKIAQQEAQLEAMQKTLQAMAGSSALGLPDLEPSTSAPSDPLAWGNGGGANPNAPRPQGQPQGNPNLPPPAPPVIEFVGGVGRASRGMGDAPASAGQVAGVKKKRFYLPVSFMPAKLLTGLKAKTVDSAKGDPEPMILRVQAPAVLPNEVRAQLEGCLVVAHGYGSLASERVEARLVSISCLDFEGKSLIDSDLKGIVLDSDGVKGIAGHPVSKMGANMARLALAGAVSGAGQAFEQSSTNISVSPLGQTQSIDPSQIGRAGAGKGISNAAEEYAKIIADLVRQQAPVIEVGPAKDVTIAVTEGAYLEVKGYEDDGGTP